MPITMITGLPRAGKSLWTIVHVKERAEREKRQVYTCNIPGITIDGWKEIDHPDKWMDIPDGSILIVDEVQDFWPNTKMPGGPPKPILELSKHGKRGIDIYFITQEPNLIHSTPRDLCAEHYYVVRAWGSHNALVHKFTRYELHPEKQRKKAEKMPFRYPKEAFGWYKSADVHNIKRKIPLRIVALPIGVVVIVVGGWFGLQTFLATVSGKSEPGALTNLLSGKPPAGLPGSATAPAARPQAAAPAPSGGGRAAPLTLAEYAQARTPRVEGLPHTAPVFDEVTRPVYAPRPAACVSMGKRCECYTQQGTQLRTPRDLCLQIVDRGYFMEWRDETVHASPAPAPASPAPDSAAPAPTVTQASLPIPAAPVERGHSPLSAALAVINPAYRGITQ